MARTAYLVLPQVGSGRKIQGKRLAVRTIMKDVNANLVVREKKINLAHVHKYASIYELVAILADTL